MLMEKDFEVMQNNMDELLTSLEDTRNDLRKTQVMLIEARMQRLEAEHRLTDALAKIAMMKKAATDAVLTLRDYLFMWLTPGNQERVKRMLRFYKELLRPATQRQYTLCSYPAPATAPHNES